MPAARARESLDEIVLVKAFDQIALGGGQGGLRRDQRQIVIDAGIDAVGFVGQRAGGQSDVGAGDFDQLGRGLDVEQRRADLEVDLAAQVGELRRGGVQMSLRRIRVAAQAGLAEEREAERADGDKVSVGADAAHLADAVVAIESQAGQTAAAIRRADGSQFDGLTLELLVIRAVSVGNGAKLFRGLRRQIAKGRRISENDLLTGVKADLALE